MRKLGFLIVLILTVRGHAQVVDVNGDGQVGPEEALTLAEQWKGPATTPNAHNHLGQSWTGDRNPLRINGTFPRQNIIVPVKEKGIGGDRAPLILENTSDTGHGLIVKSAGAGALFIGGGSEADLVLGGSFGRLKSEDPGSTLDLSAGGSIQIRFDTDNEGGRTLSFAGSNRLVGFINSEGELTTIGGVTKSEGLTRIDHPLDPAGKYLTHSSVESPDRKNVYDGVVDLDGSGQAWVELPSYFDALNADFRYQLTCIGGFAPVYVAEEIQGNRFRIAGGQPGMKVSWQVTGTRQDAYAKDHPIQVEREKSGEEKGRYLHPGSFGQPAEKGVGLVKE